MTINEWREDFKSYINELDIPKDDYNGIMEYIDDGYAMLKEKEAVRPRRIDGKRNHFVKCGNCNYDLMTGFKFCPHCGQAVKWNA